MRQLLNECSDIVELDLRVQTKRKFSHPSNISVAHPILAPLPGESSVAAAFADSLCGAIPYAAVPSSDGFCVQRGPYNLGQVKAVVAGRDASVSVLVAQGDPETDYTLSVATQSGKDKINRARKRNGNKRTSEWSNTELVDGSSLQWEKTSSKLNKRATDSLHAIMHVKPAEWTSSSDTPSSKYVSSAGRGMHPRSGIDTVPTDDRLLCSCNNLMYLDGSNRFPMCGSVNCVAPHMLSYVFCPAGTTGLGSSSAIAEATAQSLGEGTRAANSNVATRYKAADRCCGSWESEIDVGGWTKANDDYLSTVMMANLSAEWDKQTPSDN